MQIYEYRKKPEIPVKACTVHHVTQPRPNKWHAKHDVIIHGMVQHSNENGRGQRRIGGEWWVPDTYRPPCASTVDNKQFRKRCLPQTLCHLSHCTSFPCHRSCNPLEKKKENSTFFTRKTGPALKRPFYGFSAFYVDQLVNIRRHRQKREPKIVNMPSLRETCCKVTKI